MLALNSEGSLQLCKDILLRALPELDHYYAFDIKSGDNFKLNHTAYWVLDRIGSGMKYPDVLKNFIEEFEIDESTAGQDLTEILQYALDNKIIKETQL